MTKRADVRLPDGRTAQKVSRDQAEALGADKASIDAAFGAARTATKPAAKPAKSTKEDKSDA